VAIGFLAGIICYIAVGIKNRAGSTMPWTFGASMESEGSWVASAPVFSPPRSGMLPAPNGLAPRRKAFLRHADRFRSDHGGLRVRFQLCGLVVINKITPVRATREEEEAGLDTAVHGAGLI